MSTEKKKVINANEQQLLNDGFRKYRGENIHVFFSKAICAHAEIYVKGNSDVFDTKRKPWILAAATSPDEVAAVID